jgi:vacuolar-type H+-ATPase subunit C/Vma6
MADFEKRIDGELKKAKALMQELSSEEALTNAILLRYDITNLKTLLKISLKEGDAFNDHVNLDMLNSLGIIEPKLMQVMVSQKLYPELPKHIAEVAASLHEREQKPSPQEISVAIDYAYYEYVLKMDNPLVVEYFKAECDFLN